MNIKQVIIKILSIITHIGIKAPRSCDFRLKSKIINSKFEGANIIDTGTTVIDSKIGYSTVIGPSGRVINTEVGRYCSIGPNLRCVIGTHPSSVFVSTCNLFYSTKQPRGFSYVTRNKFEEFKFADKLRKKSIVIGNDVWIGDSVIILEGVTIGDGAIIAAGSVVTKDIQPYSIVGGIPARLIKYRFSEKEIEFLLKFRWWNRGECWIKDHADEFDNITSFYENNELNNQTN